MVRYPKVKASHDTVREGDCLVGSLRVGSTLEDRPSYTPRTCFDPFPFPRPTDDQRAAIAAAAKQLHEVRQSALDNDPQLTLTKLYNKRPTWTAGDSDRDTATAPSRRLALPRRTAGWFCRV